MHVTLRGLATVWRLLVQEIGLVCDLESHHTHISKKINTGRQQGSESLTLYCDLRIILYTYFTNRRASASNPQKTHFTILTPNKTLQIKKRTHTQSYIFMYTYSIYIKKIKDVHILSNTQIVAPTWMVCVVVWRTNVVLPRKDVAITRFSLYI